MYFQSSSDEFNNFFFKSAKTTSKLFEIQKSNWPTCLRYSIPNWMCTQVHSQNIWHLFPSTKYPIVKLDGSRVQNFIFNYREFIGISGTFYSIELKFLENSLSYDKKLFGKLIQTKYLKQLNAENYFSRDFGFNLVKYCWKTF